MTGTAASLAGFVLLLAAGVALEVRGRRRTDAATAGAVVTASMRTMPGRIVVLATWIWLGVHFLAR